MNFRLLSLALLLIAVTSQAQEVGKSAPEGVKIPPEIPTSPHPEPTTTSTTSSPTNITTSTTTPAPTTSSTTTTSTTATPPTTTSSTTTTTTPVTTTPVTTTSTKPTPPVTTTPAPVTTTAAPLPQNVWIVKDKNGTVCIIAFMTIKITVPYKAKAENKTVELNAEFKLDCVENATASGECGDSVQTLTLTWENKTSTLTFVHHKGNATYVLGGIEVDIPVNNNTFPNNTWTNATKISFKHDAQVFDIPVNRSYTCSNVNPLTLNGTAFSAKATLNGTILGSITVSKVHVEAFGLGKDGKYYTSLDCSPSLTPDIVPIVVALVLAGLVVVVLIAYLVGRRRAQARGYLSM